MLSIVVLLAVGSVVLLLVRDGSEPIGSNDAFAVHTGAEPDEREQAARVADTLMKLPAELAAGRADALSPEARTRMAEAQAVFPPNTTVAIDVSSWQRTGTVASVAAEVRRPEDPSPVVYLVLLVRGGDGWLLSEVYAQQPLPAAS